jgi:hypothetical protein
MNPFLDVQQKSEQSEQSMQALPLNLHSNLSSNLPSNIPMMGSLPQVNGGGGQGKMIFAGGTNGVAPDNNISGGNGAVARATQPMRVTKPKGK